MAGRKRKMPAMATEVREQEVNNNKHKKQTSVKKVKEQLPCQSHYFVNNNNTTTEDRLTEEFFKQPCITLAKAFLGKVLVRRCADGAELRGRIVETEAYLGGEDRASHSAGGKRTERNTAMFMKPGTIYVYPIYGIYLCMNISSEGEGAAVLLRSAEPLQGQSIMKQLRSARRKEGARQLKDKELCNGPSKLCQALNIPRCFDRRDLASDPEVWLEGDPNATLAEPRDIVSAPRVGIESHGEWAKRPWRFYLRGHPCVSVVNKEAENQPQSGNDLAPSDEQPDKGQNIIKKTQQEFS
ncbi:DNA-3-methyladenine glycosylase [Solea senegalensis]|uniref:DNA-3-methyladenine glycosylase n=1 Tax=Solea senegalensis TaxID=28829 RepID=A0AAV6RKN2_SOLSE|nr:DNA-3-methyladenine glycosylase [Solea senegalensis]KAG7505958.1 DNA-3-methyladenine glycosylase [Solea senegalensis]